MRLTPPSAPPRITVPSIDAALQRILAAAAGIGSAASATIRIDVVGEIDPDGDGFLPPVKASTGLTVRLQRGALSFTVDGQALPGAR